MLTSLLNTKLYFPPLRPCLVPRQRLVERLQIGLQGPLTLVSAPAGSGKTTLLSEWRLGPGRNRPLAWLSVDAGDNDPLLFFQYLSAALDTVCPGLAQKVLPLLQSPEPIPSGTILTFLINALSETGQDFILVLDDYHFIENTLIYKSMTFLVDNLPPRLHLVILTRADPVLPLARLRARGQLVEIRAEHLRFTTEEASTFLNDVMGLNLSIQDVAALDARTEGWIAGLQLAALSLQKREDVGSFVSAFTGNYRYIADYLVEEVLNRQPEGVQAFLLETSVLARMNAPLCSAVTGIADAQVMLEYLERSNLFLIPLSEERDWYRYHHLFADQLRARLGRLRARQIPIIQCRASDWCAEHNLIEEAITYALQANDVERAAPLIEQVAIILTGQGRVETLSRWISALPESVIDKRPRLGLSLAWALYIEYQFEQTEARIHQIEQNLIPEEASLYCGELALWHGILARRRSDVDRSRDFLLQALEQLPVESAALRGRTWVFLGLGYLESDIHKAREAFIQAGYILEAKNNLQGSLAALYFLAWSQILQGRLGQAAVTSQRALQLADQAQHLPVASYAHLAMAELLCERNELEGAAHHVTRGTELAESGGHTDNLLIALLVASRIQRAGRNWEKAQKLIAKAGELARSTIPWMRLQVINEQIYLYLAQGKSNEAAEWLQQNQTSPGIRSLIPGLDEQIIETRLRVARHEAREALPQLATLLDQIKELGLLRWEIQIHCLQALAFNHLGQTNDALSQFKSALALGEPEDSIQAFLDEGLPMLELLRLAQKREIAPRFISRLMAAFVRQDSREAVQPAATQFVLSKREVELLRLVAAGHSNKEIAAELVITLGTVKRHTVNIFNKLGAKNRTEAVAKARELGLL